MKAGCSLAVRGLYPVNRSTTHRALEPHRAGASRLFQHAVDLALVAGATRDQIVPSLEALMPVTGAARVVQCAPKIALALGYDVDAALGRLVP